MPIKLPKSDLTVAYSFRTTEKIMEDLKKYATAKNTTVPKTLNKIIKDSLKNKTLTRELNRGMRIPAHKQLTSKEIEKLNNTEKEWTNNPKYIQHENKWFKICPKIYAYYNNCLDVWKNDTYQSNNAKLKHEGIYTYLDINKKTIYIKINQYLNSEYFAYIINRKEAVELAEKSENNKLIEFVEKNEGMNKITFKVTLAPEDYEKIKSENIKLHEKIEQLKLLLKTE